MLTQLSIKGLAIIENLSIVFSNRLNVITGETGAGKSILIKALSLVTGGKASADVVRKGFGAAVVTASFHLPSSHRVHQILIDLGLDEGSQDQEELMVRRQISSKGRSQAWINDIPVTLGSLKILGEALIDIFAQHENHRLLDPNLHLLYLDKFLSKGNHVNVYQNLFDQVTEELKEIHTLIQRYQLKAKERDYLSFRRNELLQLNPEQSDYEELESYCSRASRAVEEIQIVSEAQQILDCGFQEKPLSHGLVEVMRRLKKLRQKSDLKFLDELISNSQDIESRLNDMSFSLGKLTVELDVDERELDRCQERLGAYKDLFRKLGVQDISELIMEKVRLDQELEFLESAESELIRRLNILEKNCQKLDEMSRKLSEERQKAFFKVQQRIKSELGELNMKGAYLEAEFSPVQHAIVELDLKGFDQKVHQFWKSVTQIITRLTRNGAEKVQFLLAANPGEPAKPLAKIASGGELSRIMLGIKKVLSVGADTCVMVFDEIDTGISGKTANIVGAKLREFSQSFQVICISHLPQVAAFGDAHFKVEKSLKKGRTESSIYLLDPQKSAEEIARLLSGDEITGPSLANAKLLIHNAQTVDRPNSIR